MGEQTGLNHRWLVIFDRPSGDWCAMPTWREWTVEGSLYWNNLVVGPRGTKYFRSQVEAMNYAYDTHHAYGDGWIA